MRAIRLKHASVAIPFRTAFAHASAKRRRAENILVQVADADGRVGYGEGCPRAYVTGETVETARAFLDRQHDALLDIDGLDALHGWLSRHAADIDRNPSAACAAELALLDLLSRQQGQSLERFLGLPDGADLPPVTAVYGITSGPVFALQRVRFVLNGMTDAKLKLGGRPDEARRAAALARIGRLRLDANNLWSDADSAIAGLARLAPSAWAVEESVSAHDWPGLRQVADETGLRIILDESLNDAADFQSVAGDARFVLNLRVSRLGGVIRTLALVETARSHGHDLIIGAQVGETSLLARAGILAAVAAGPALAATELGYGLQLLRYDLVAPSLTFGRGGRLDPPPPNPGTGLQPTPALQAAFADR